MRRPHLQHQADDKKRDAAKSRHRQKHKATVPVTPQGARLQPQHHQLSCKRRDRQGNCDVLWLNQGVAAWCWRLTLALSGRAQAAEARRERTICCRARGAKATTASRSLERVVRPPGCSHWDESPSQWTQNISQVYRLTAAA